MTVVAAILCKVYIDARDARRRADHLALVESRRAFWLRDFVTVGPEIEWYDETAQARAVAFADDGSSATATFLRSHKWLKSVDLSQRTVSPEIWDAVVGLPSLENLDLTYAVLPSEGLESAARLSKLKWLVLYDSHATEEQAFAILQAPAMEEVYLNEAAVSDRVCHRLGAMPRLRTLGLSGVKLSQQQLRALAGAPIRVLDVSGANLKDAAVKEIAAMTELENLNLARCRLSATGLQPLLGLPKLDCVNVHETGVTDETWAQFTREYRERWGRPVRLSPH